MLITGFPNGLFLWQAVQYPKKNEPSTCSHTRLYTHEIRSHTQRFYSRDHRASHSTVQKFTHNNPIPQSQSSRVQKPPARYSVQQVYTNPHRFPSSATNDADSLGPIVRVLLSLCEPLARNRRTTHQERTASRALQLYTSRDSRRSRNNGTMHLNKADTPVSPVGFRLGGGSRDRGREPARKSMELTNSMRPLMLFRL